MKLDLKRFGIRAVRDLLEMAQIRLAEGEEYLGPCKLCERYSDHKECPNCPATNVCHEYVVGSEADRKEILRKIIAECHKEQKRRTRKILRKVLRLAFLCEDPTRKVLAGLKVDPDYYVATDGRMMIAVENTEHGKEAFVPKDIALWALRLFAKKDHVELAITTGAREGSAMFSISKDGVWYNVVDNLPAKYPAWKQVFLPKNRYQTATISFGVGVIVKLLTMLKMIGANEELQFRFPINDLDPLEVCGTLKDGRRIHALLMPMKSGGGPLKMFKEQEGVK